MNPEILKQLKEIMFSTLDAIKAAGPTGAPAGVLYAGLMSYGCNITQFESLMSALERTGKIRREGDLVFAIQ